MQIAGKGVKNKVGVFTSLNMYSTELMHYGLFFHFLFGSEFCIYFLVPIIWLSAWVNFWFWKIIWTKFWRGKLIFYKLNIDKY